MSLLLKAFGPSFKLMVKNFVPKIQEFLKANKAKPGTTYRVTIIQNPESVQLFLIEVSEISLNGDEKTVIFKRYFEVNESNIDFVINEISEKF